MLSKKARLSLILSVTILVLFGTINLAAKEKYEEKFDRTFELARKGKVTIKNISGNIEVKTWDKAEVKIYALKVSKESSLEKAKEKAGLVKIEVSKNGNTLHIETKFPRKTAFKSINVSVSYWLTIPSEASISADSVSGDISLEKIGGTAKAETVSGDVDCTHVKGTFRGKSVSGDVEVAYAEKGADCSSVSGDLILRNITGDMDLNTVSGEITVESASGSIEAEVISGDVELIKISHAERVKVSALSGSIDYVGMIEADGRYMLKSHSGNVTLVLPSGAAFDLEAKTFSGKINSDFEITVTGKLSSRELRGSVNGGGAEVSIKTFSGNIYLKK